MAIHQPGLWIISLALFGFYLWVMLSKQPMMSSASLLDFDTTRTWQIAGEIVFFVNLFTPLITGIYAADRLKRDYQTNMRRLQNSTPTRLGIYLLSKYSGVLAATLSPILLFLSATGLGLCLFAGAPAKLLLALLTAFISITLPAHLFVTAFSLAGPLFMPIRVYQVLFIGYWFWANAINPDAMPTLNGTILTPIGYHALHGFFGSRAFSADGTTVYTPQQAILNITILCLSACAVLVGLQQYLKWQKQQ